MEDEKLEQLRSEDALNESWNRMYALLTEYRNEFGHCNVPLSLTYNNVKLGNWVNTQRKNYNCMNMSENRIKKLEDIGFIWSSIDNLWERMYNLLTEYMNEYGNCNVPASFIYKKEKLGNWVSNQRRVYIACEMPMNRIKKLEDIGFVWSSHDEVWRSMYALLTEYRNEFGHCNVLRKSEYRDKNLGEWVSKQRQAKKIGALPIERIELLDKLDFIWDVNSFEKNKNYRLLEEYKKEHGICLPSKDEVYKGVNIGRWVRRQKLTYKENEH
jgi:ribosomal protein L7Ae-like RNA K-turn-binding protein